MLKTTKHFRTSRFPRCRMMNLPENVKPAGLALCLEDDPRWALVRRILESEHFSRAPKLQQFLLYIAERALLQRYDEISEQQIGVRVFGRHASYNPGEDNIVRSYARTLRKRLGDYFETEDNAEELIVEVPRGGYIPVFKPRSSLGRGSATSSAVPDRGSGNQPGDLRPERRFSLPSSLQVFVTIALAAVACALSFWRGEQHAASRSSPALHSFWAQIAGNSGLILVPSDTGLTMILGLTRRSATVAEYVTGEYLSPPEAKEAIPEGWAKVGVHRYADLMDVVFVSRYLRLPELSPEKTTIRYARDLRMDELKVGNAVLLGGSNANPWVQLFDRDLNFHLVFRPQDRTFDVVNRQPAGDERPKYFYTTNDPQWRSYGLVALQPNLTRTGWVLIVEGVSASGLQVGAEFLLDEKNVRYILEKASDAGGRLKPFEILLETYNVGSNATNVEVLGMRVH